MSQPQPLFQPEDVPRHCQAEGCGAILLPGQERVPTCAHERERAMGGTWKRPKGCLNGAPDPRYAAFPEGY